MGLLDVGKQIKISNRPLDIIYAIDVSESMKGSKLEALNNAMHELEYALKEEAKNNPAAQVYVRVFTFGGISAKKHISRTAIENYHYVDIEEAEGRTPMDCAVRIMSEIISVENMSNKSLRPVLVLITDGEPSNCAVYLQRVKELKALPWGKKAIRIGIAIDEEADKDLLAEFVSDKDCLLDAYNSTKLVECIKWTSTLITYSTETSHGNKEVKMVEIPKKDEEVEDKTKGRDVNNMPTMLFDKGDY